ncbi:metaxin-2 isoform X3 [Halyomorpha halys]|uniref:metaxin-2 isoform X3 n=1 Tax=Halyomorpha halys TaxID=286706 RepID=UPI0006D4ED7B|nr:metaxin-2-like isoform X3 [Halyomorpha halys]
MKNSSKLDVQDKSLSSIPVVSPEISNISLEVDLETKLKNFRGTNTIEHIKKELLKNWDSNCVAFLNGGNFESLWIGKEPWPDDVKLYQPYETEQILLPDMANCLAVQAFLKMCQLDFTVQYKANAEDMSPSGRVPFIKCGACLVSDLEPITNFVASKGVALTDHLDPSQKSDMRTYMSLVNTVLGNAENYITWVENETYSNVTKPRYGSVHPFPLNHILSFLKRQAVTKRLNALGWYRKSLDKVYEEVERACNALSERLGKERFFFGEKPCELDALVFGHIFTIITTPLPSNRFACIVRGYPNLIEHCKIIEHKFFNFYEKDNV